jgi:hypothetical protein
MRREREKEDGQNGKGKGNGGGRRESLISSSEAKESHQPITSGHRLAMAAVGGQAQALAGGEKGQFLQESAQANSVVVIRPREEMRRSGLCRSYCTSALHFNAVWARRPWTAAATG